MSVRFVSWLFLPAAALAASACSGSSAPAPARPAQEAGRPPVAVTVAPAAASAFEESVEIIGTLQPKFSADVKSEITGTVKAVYVTEWVPVRKGAVLAQLDTSEAEAGVAALKAVEAQARVAEARARREYDRALQLKQYGLITPQNLDDAKTAVEAAEAATAAAVAQTRTGETRLAKARIVAPIDGVVALRGINVGDRVENMGGSAPVFRIVDTRLFDLTASVPSSQAASVRVGQPIRFTTDSAPGRTFEGRVKFINPEVDAASRSTRVGVEVPNPDGQLKGGAFVEGRIVVASRTDVLQVPREALMNWNVEEQRAQVFVARGGLAEKRDVKTGVSGGATVEILSGLQAGDPVVIRGAFGLQSGDRITVATGEGA
ncbi:MAG TPA: efflux RND transporter periplasmic adaptor subunit [Vicinamibacterales bacterium]|nr:efflux RND transporter periplasmic adaptor subunit [Vicinamibacterales bacterium]HPW21774.1 efflux RND transporter periplasmic adaptor subunit [Vicinamibacterales bacterium]